MWIQVSSGRGPVECELAVMLFTEKFLQGFCRKEKIDMEILEVTPGGRKRTAKSVLIALEGSKEKLDAVILKICGTMQWIQKSPCRKEHGRKNWFFSCSVIEEPSRYSFSEKEIEVETTRSSGPGGQNVNRVETAVRVKHIPSGITVFASEERSQGMNRRLALARLQESLLARHNEKEESRKRNSWMQHNSLERGNPVRVFKGMNFSEIPH